MFLKHTERRDDQEVKVEPLKGPRRGRDPLCFLE